MGQPPLIPELRKLSCFKTSELLSRCSQGFFYGSDLHVQMTPLREESEDEMNGVEYMQQWYEAKANPKLIVIDMWEYFRPVMKKGRGIGNAYNIEYELLKDLQAFARRNEGITVLLVHHLRKSTGHGDIIDQVSGSAAMVGAPDTVAIFRRTGENQLQGILHLKGRDIAETELLLQGGEDHWWNLVGQEDTVRKVSLSKERREIIDLLTEMDKPLSPKEIGVYLGKDDGAIRQLLYKLHNQPKPLIKKVGDKYALPNISNSSNASKGSNTVISNISNGDNGNTTSNGTELNDSQGYEDSVTGVTAVTGDTELGGVLNLLRKDHPIPCSRIKKLVACGHLSSDDGIMAANHILDGEVLEAAKIMNRA